MANTSTLFTGASRYSADFQNVINRAVAIASLPLNQLQSAKNNLQAQSAALSALQQAFESFQSALSGLQNATGLAGYTTAVSNGAVLSAGLSSGAMTGIWSVEVVSLGAWTSTLSKDGLTTVTDPASQNISSASSFTLTVNGTPTGITPQAGTLNGLVEAINQAGLDVEASIVNVGSALTPDYRLAVRSKKLDAVAIQLSDGSQQLLDTLAAGSKASYKVNGMATPLESDSRTVSLAPGLAITLLSQSQPGVATTITVSRSTTALSNALSGFVTAYNAALGALDAHRGEKAGALAGQSIVRTLSDALRELTRYESGSAQVRNLTDLGLTFDDKGRLSLDATTFQSAAGDNPAPLLKFLGSTDGEGFLRWASDVLEGLLDSTDGALTLTANTLKQQIASQHQRIEAEQERVDRIQADLVARMAAADAMIAALEQQATYINQLFESMRIAARMYSW